MFGHNHVGVVAPQSPVANPGPPSRVHKLQNQELQSQYIPKTSNSEPIYINSSSSIYFSSCLFVFIYLVYLVYLVYLSIYLSLYLSIYLFAYLFIHMSLWLYRLFLSLSLFLYFSLSQSPKESLFSEVWIAGRSEGGACRIQVGRVLRFSYWVGPWDI